MPSLELNPARTPGLSRTLGAARATWPRRRLIPQPVGARNVVSHPLAIRTARLGLLVAFATAVPTAQSAAPADEVEIADGLRVISGPVNGVRLNRGSKTLAIYGDPRPEPAAVDLVLFTHHHRDVAWAGRRLVEKGARAVVPAAEQDPFAKVESFWAKHVQARFHDYSQQTTKVLTRPIPVSRTVNGGDQIEWEGATIRVLDTPGPTRGSVSYLLETSGKRIAFTGDLVLGDGKLLELYGLQDAIPEAKIGGYHGWAGRLGQVMESLRRIEAERPDLIVPARGPVIREPAAALRTLGERIRAVYSNYLSVDALRWYFGDDHIRAKARRVLGPEAVVDWMPMAETRPLPDWVRAIENTRLIVADDQSGFLIDCGSRKIMDEVKTLQDGGKLGAVKDLFITHYHDDHTDAAAAFVKDTGAQVHACGSLRQVLERPAEFRLPCLTANPVVVLGKHNHGDSWRWKEFQFTILDFPGQTLHHNALLAKKDGGEAILFVGDSFTPSGLDDYCLQNRNLLHEGTGLLRCLDLIEQEAAGAFLINQHVGPCFRFDRAQLDRMRQTLRQRRDLLTRLFPWDDPGFGIDDGWVSAERYAIAGSRGQSSAVGLRILNHSPVERTFHARIHVPDDLELALPAEGFARIAPRQSGAIPFGIKITANTRPGIHVLTYDVRWEGGDLREWCEVLLDVRGRP